MADVNGDGRIDIIKTPLQYGKIAVLEGNGDGTIGSPIDSATNFIDPHPVVADFNADSLPDVAALAHLTVHDRAAGERRFGTFTAEGSFGVGLQLSSIVSGDFNHDGRPDIAALNTATVSVLTNRTD